MSLSAEKKALIQARITGIRAWMLDEAPYVVADQSHLDAHTPERAYWHYGYLSALEDIIRLGDSPLSQTPDTEGTTN